MFAECTKIIKTESNLHRLITSLMAWYNGNTADLANLGRQLKSVLGKK